VARGLVVKATRLMARLRASAELLELEAGAFKQRADGHVSLASDVMAANEREAGAQRAARQGSHAVHVAHTLSRHGVFSALTRAAHRVPRATGAALAIELTRAERENGDLLEALAVAQRAAQASQAEVAETGTAQLKASQEAHACELQQLRADHLTIVDRMRVEHQAEVERHEETVREPQAAHAHTRDPRGGGTFTHTRAHADPRDRRSRREDAHANAPTRRPGGSHARGRVRRVSG
jgi:hypothetical protein